jgi:hypothetical protein
MIVYKRRNKINKYSRLRMQVLTMNQLKKRWMKVHKILTNKKLKITKTLKLIRLIGSKNLTGFLLSTQTRDIHSIFKHITRCNNYR